MCGGLNGGETGKTAPARCIGGGVERLYKRHPRERDLKSSPKKGVFKKIAAWVIKSRRDRRKASTSQSRGGAILGMKRRQGKTRAMRENR